MGPLAKLLARMGHVVSGSDLVASSSLDSLGRDNVETWVGSRPSRMEECALVVASAAVPRSDPELGAARSAGVVTWDRARLLGAITAAIPTLGFTGTHGKTTSTALAVSATHGLGLDPSYLVGGDLVGHEDNAHLGTDDLLLLEADEAYGTFGHLALAGLVVTNVDIDHLDHYGTPERLEEAFVQVVERVEGPVVVGLDDPGGARLAARTGKPGYGIHPEAVWRIEELTPAVDLVRFRLSGRFAPAEVTIGRPGLHNAQNATGVLALLAEMGHDIAGAIDALARFKGVHRRLEHRSTVRGVAVIDSYAHLPAEIAADIDALRPMDRNRLWVVFQPHLYSRTLALAGEFGAALAKADRVVVTDIYGARESAIAGVTGRLVADAVDGSGVDSSYVPGLDEAERLVSSQAEEGDVVLILGAGDISTLPGRLIRSLSAPL